MKFFEIFALLITLSAFFSYLNHRYLKLPVAIGLMLLAMALSLIVTILGWLGWGVDEMMRTLVISIDFNQTLMGGLLGFLLFAGALHINLESLLSNKWTIGLLSSLGVIGSTLLVGTLTSLITGVFGIPISYIYCLVFGALISPTDPVAVLSILKSSGAPSALQAKIKGESLFNDGVGVVVFSLLLDIAIQGNSIEFIDVLIWFSREALGGIFLGLVTGYLAYLVLKSLDSYQVEVLVTIALVAGGYALALKLHTSGPMCVVVAGLMIGNHGRLMAMSRVTREHLDNFWELIDEIINGVLFILIGLEVLILSFTYSQIVLVLMIIPMVVVVRFITVGFPVSLMRLFRSFSPGAIRILTWGGIRGGISVALALSMPVGPERNFILPVAYCVVVFSIVVQGLSLGWLVKKVEKEKVSNP